MSRLIVNGVSILNEGTSDIVIDDHKSLDVVAAGDR